jgi:hypothetical protein
MHRTPRIVSNAAAVFHAVAIWFPLRPESVMGMRRLARILTRLEVVPNRAAGRAMRVTRLIIRRAEFCLAFTYAVASCSGASDTADDGAHPAARLKALSAGGMLDFPEKGSFARGASLRTHEFQ